MITLGFLDGFWNQLSPGQATFIQTLVLVIGGVWAFRKYRVRRENQPKVTIGATWRLLRRPGERTVLIVHVQIVNASNVLLRGLVASATVYDATESDPATNDIIRRTYAERDLLDDPVTDPPSAGTPPPPSPAKPRKVEPNLIEPGETIETEVAVVLNEELPGLLAGQISVDVPRGKWSTVKAYVRHPRIYSLFQERDSLYWSWTYKFLIDPPQKSADGGWWRRKTGTTRP